MRRAAVRRVCLGAAVLLGTATLLAGLGRSSEPSPLTPRAAAAPRPSQADIGAAVLHANPELAVEPHGTAKLRLPLLVGSLGMSALVLALAAGRVEGDEGSAPRPLVSPGVPFQRGPPLLRSLTP